MSFTDSVGRRQPTETHLAESNFSAARSVKQGSRGPRNSDRMVTKLVGRETGSCRWAKVAGHPDFWAGGILEYKVLEILSCRAFLNAFSLNL